MTGSYTFWLAVVSLACLAAERVAPWRKEQRLLRQGLAHNALHRWRRFFLPSVNPRR